jgi:hypothetical protein
MQLACSLVATKGRELEASNEEQALHGKAETVDGLVTRIQFSRYNSACCTGAE